MQNARRASSLPVAFALAVAIVLVGHDAFGNRHLSAPTTKVATIDLSRVFERINVNASLEIQLNAITDQLNTEAESRTEAINQELRKAVELDKTDPDGAQDIRDRVALMKLELEEWGSLKQLELDRERALMWKSIYMSIRKQTTNLAEAEGWDIVLVNDSLGEVKLGNEMNVSREQQVISQILNRRMIYASTATDITEQLIVRINNLGP